MKKKLHAMPHTASSYPCRCRYIIQGHCFPIAVPNANPPACRTTTPDQLSFENIYFVHAMPLEELEEPVQLINIDTHIRTHACTPRTQTHASWAQWCTHTVQRTRCNDMRTAGTMKSNAPSLIEKYNKLWLWADKTNKIKCIHVGGCAAKMHVPRYC